MSDFVRILVDEAAAAAPNVDDRGWRFRVFREDGESRFEVFEEQVWPEKVASPGANHFRAQNAIWLTRDQATWLIETLRDALAEDANG